MLFGGVSEHKYDLIAYIFSYRVKGPILTMQEKKMTDSKTQAIVCFDFSKHLPDIFVICLEDGSIIQCSMSGANEMKGNFYD